MPKKVAVILAYNPENTGMYSVDLAGFNFFKNSGVEADFYSPYFHPRLAISGYGSVKIKPYTKSKQLEKYETIVFWGDFTTNPKYGLVDFVEYIDDLNFTRGLIRPQTLARKIIINLYGLKYEESFDEWKRLYLLSDQEKGSRRFFSVGQNFQSLGSAGKLTDISQLEKYYNRFSGIYPRDSVSVEQIKKHFPHAAFGDIRLGLDCSFLLGKMGNSSIGAKQKKVPRVGYFFFRSGFSNLNELLIALKETGAEVFSINNWLTLPRSNPHEHFIGLMNVLSSCDVVVSDTYHLLINTLREGVVPFGLGVKSDAQYSCVCDFKKKVLFKDLLAEDLYKECNAKEISGQELIDIKEKVSSLLSSSAEHDVHGILKNNIEEFRDMLKRRLFG